MCVSSCSWLLTLNFKLLQVFCHYTPMTLSSCVPGPHTPKGGRSWLPPFYGLWRWFFPTDWFWNFGLISALSKPVIYCCHFHPSQLISLNLRINISDNEIRLDQLMASRGFRIVNSRLHKYYFCLHEEKLPSTKLPAGIWKIKGYY